MHIELNVMALNPTKFTEPLLNAGRDPHLKSFSFSKGTKTPTWCTRSARRASRKGPCHHRTAEKCYELAPLHVPRSGPRLVQLI